MKGAIGNAFLLNVVITFILIFFSLLIGSMAYSKAYKTKNFLLNLVEQFQEEGKSITTQNRNEWNNLANEYLSKVGYTLVTTKSSCPDKSDGKKADSKKDTGYQIWRNKSVGDYDYCIYKRLHVYDADSIMNFNLNYMVLVYMKFDFPIIGEFIKIPITGETKTFTVLK